MKWYYDIAKLEDWSCDQWEHAKYNRWPPGTESQFRYHPTEGFVHPYHEIDYSLEEKGEAETYPEPDVNKYQ